MTYTSTTILTSGCVYKNTPEEFFAYFSHAWDAVRCQVAKIETRQIYQEPDNISYCHFMAGNFDVSLAVLADSRAVDDSLYAMLRARGVDFVRCRPIKFPMSAYLKWAIYSYKYNASQGERIFWCNEVALREYFGKYVQHDFMIFDSRFAVIHNYNDDGLIIGGWLVEDSDRIGKLLSIFSFIKANCHPFEALNVKE